MQAVSQSGVDGFGSAVRTPDPILFGVRSTADELPLFVGE
jgi:hypothetical protein